MHRMAQYNAITSVLLNICICVKYLKRLFGSEGCEFTASCVDKFGINLFVVKMI